MFLVNDFFLFVIYIYEFNTGCFLEVHNSNKSKTHTVILVKLVLFKRYRYASAHFSNCRTITFYRNY